MTSFWHLSDQEIRGILRGKIEKTDFFRLCRSSDLFLEFVPPEEEGKGVFEASVFCDQVQEGRLEGLVLRDLRGDLETWLVGWRVVDCVVHLGVGELDDVGQMIGEGDACVVGGVDPGLAPGIAAV